MHFLYFYMLLYSHVAISLLQEWLLTAMTRNIEDPFVGLLTNDFIAKCISVMLLITAIPYLIKTFYEKYNHIFRSYFSWCCNSTDSNQHSDLIVKYLLFYLSSYITHSCNTDRVISYTSNIKLVAK